METDAITRRRGAAVHDRILETTLATLVERGYAFTIEEVAEAANVHKTTIYRRWGTKAVLVGAAVERLAEAAVPIPVSDSPLADLRELLVLVARALRTVAGAQAIRTAVAACADDPTVIDATSRFLTMRYESACVIIERAKDAGTLRRDLDSVMIWQAMVNPLHLRAILGEPADDDVAQGLFDLVVTGAKTA